MRNPADFWEREVHTVNQIARRLLSSLCACSLLLTGCHSLFSGDTTVLLPAQEMLLPAVKYAYDNPLTTDQFASNLPNAFKLDDRAIGDIITFECLDYLEDTGEFIYFYQSVLEDDNYRAAYAAYEAEAAIYSIDPASEYYKTYHLPLYREVKAAYDVVRAEQTNMTRRYTQRNRRVGYISVNNYETYRVAYIEQLREYETLLETYINKYWPDTFVSVIGADDLRSYYDTNIYCSAAVPMEPPKPEPQPPSAPGSSVSELMITHMAAYNYETKEIRDFFVQETGPNAEQTAFAYKIPDSDNYMLYFGGQAYFYEPDGTCYLQVNFRPQLARVTAAIEDAYSARDVTVTDVTPFSGGSDIYMYLMVETGQIGEDTEVAETDLEDYNLPEDAAFYVSIHCSLVDSDFYFEYTLPTQESDPGSLKLQGGEKYYNYFGAQLQEIDQKIENVLPDDSSWYDYFLLLLSGNREEYDRLTALRDDIVALYNGDKPLVYWNDPSSKVQVSDLGVDASLLNVALTAPTGSELLQSETTSISLGGFIGAHEPIMAEDGEIYDAEGKSYDPKQYKYKQVRTVIHPIADTAYLAIFTTHVSGSESLGATPLSGGGRVIPSENSIRWEGTQGVALTRTESFTFTNAEGRSQSDTVLSVNDLKMWGSSGFENSFAVFTSKNIYLYFFKASNQRTLPDSWHRVTMPMDKLLVNTTYAEDNPDLYHIYNFTALSENDYIVSNLHNGVVRVYMPRDDTTLRVVQLQQVPVFQTWRLSDGSFIAVGFDTAGKQYTSMDFPKARVLHFDVEEQLNSYPSRPGMQ
jgi:hypothetical protein